MSIEDDFLAELRSRPYDNVVRLVYADWLEQIGDPDRAAVLRAYAKADGPRWTNTDRVPAEWLALVDPAHARRDPTWRAAVLGDPAARAQLGELAPPLLATLVADRSVRDREFEDWPRAVVEHLALAAGADALAALRDRLPDDTRRRCEDALARAERELATRSSEERDATDTLAELERALYTPYRGEAIFCLESALQYVLRACGPNLGRNRYDRGVPGAASLAIAHAVSLHHELAWERDGIRRRHQRAATLEGTADAAEQRIARWAARARGRVARAVHEADPDRERAWFAAKHARLRELAVAAREAAVRARSECPPAPPIAAIDAAFYARISEAVLLRQ